MIVSSGTMFLIRNMVSFCSFCCWVENAASPAPGVLWPLRGVCLSHLPHRFLFDFKHPQAARSLLTVLFLHHCYSLTVISLIAQARGLRVVPLSWPRSLVCARMFPAEPLASTELQASALADPRELSRAAWCLCFVLSFSSASA